jgi:hypothetical protein
MVGCRDLTVASVYNFNILAYYELFGYQGGENLQRFNATQSDYTLKMTPAYSSETLVNT